MFRQTRTINPRSTGITLLLLLVVFGGAMLVFSPKVAALSAVGPDPNDLGGLPGDDFSYVVSSINYGSLQIHQTEVVVYFDNNFGTKTISVVDADLCTGSPGNQRDRETSPVNGNLASYYYLLNSKTGSYISSIVKAYVNNASNCYYSVRTVTFAGSGLTYDPDSQKYKAIFVGQIDEGLTAGLNRFRISICTTVACNGQGAIVGYSSGGNAKSFGVARDAPADNGYRDYTIPFAPDCRMNGTTSQVIQLYDLDNPSSLVQPTPITTYIQEFNAAGAFVQNVPVTAIQGASWSAVGNNRYIIKGASDVNINIVFPMREGYKYKLGMENVYFVNILQFHLPFDSIYFLTGCKAPVTLSCGTMTVSPMPVEPNQTIIIKATINYTGSPPPPSPKSINVKNASGTYSRTFDPAFDGSTPNVFTLIEQFNAGPVDLYTVTWSLTTAGKTITCGGNYNALDSFRVLNHPFFDVKQGDVVAGVNMPTDKTPGPGTTNCSTAPTNSQAGIVSWNRDGTPPLDYTGAGVQYAAFALSYIQDFATGQRQLSGLGRQPSGKAFSNVSSVPVTTSIFGGMFAAGVPCADLWNNHPSTATDTMTSIDAGSKTSGIYYTIPSGGQLVLNTSTIPIGRHITLYVKGDVSITGNIVYDQNGWTTRQDIPSFKLIVQGNIFIDKDVTNLDGVYAAIPTYPISPTTATFDKPSDGTIATCSDGFASYDPNKILITPIDINGYCRNPLTFTGSVIANQLWLLRTGGSFGSDTPAERFIYSPEIWLTPADAGGSASSNYDSIIGLPPIL